MATTVGWSTILASEPFGSALPSAHRVVSPSGSVMPTVPEERGTQSAGDAPSNRAAKRKREVRFRASAIGASKGYPSAPADENVRGTKSSRAPDAARDALAVR